MNRSQTFLLGLIAVFAALAFVIVLPFVEYVVLAALLAYVLHPVHRRLEPRLGEMAAAITLIIGTLLAIVGPLLYVISVFISDLRTIARGESGLDVTVLEARTLELTGIEVDLSEILTSSAQQIFTVLFGGVGGVVATTLKIGMGIAVMVFLLYYLLLEGEAFVVWFYDLVPLPDHITERLLQKLDATTWGVVVGHISVAIAQALLAGVGLWVAGVPDASFWTFIMVILSLLPLIGAFMVWGPAAAYLVVVGDVGSGVLLALYGLTVVSLFDNYARPIVIDRRAHINPGVLLLGVVGGIYAVGFTGVFVGPIVIGVFVAAMETYRTEFDAV
ncbi:AI-2E family transporter [Natronomonas gomsonensis]|uniref:AI-2E family transporter n=1 Tax=Natronomonas gomsonensis TaxID=1046043 RepID=UPI0015BFBE9E|nr:AI-2E family transporter [Natronomonas gomsonensis]